MIVDLRQSGVAILDIARQFGISRGRVTQIIHQVKNDKERESRCTEFMDRIRACDDVEQKWDVERWLECLFLSTKALRILSHHYRMQNETEICIPEFMDLIIDIDSTNLESRYTSHPILLLKHAGKKTLHELFEKLTTLNLGDALNQEWNTRLMVYMRHDLIFKRLFGGMYGACDVEFKKSYVEKHCGRHV